MNTMMPCMFGLLAVISMTAAIECDVDQMDAVSAATFMVTKLFKRAAGNNNLLTQAESEEMFCGGAGQCEGDLADVVQNSHDAADADNNGQITPAELAAYFNSALTESSDPTILEYMGAVVSLLDTDGSGTVSAADNTNNMMSLLCGRRWWWGSWRSSSCFQTALREVLVFDCSPSPSLNTMSVTAEKMAAVFEIAKPNIQVIV